MSRRQITAFLVAFGLSLAVAGPSTAASADGANRPNIVLITMDDVSPDAEHLWSDASRTPALARFVEQGLEFENATTSTPLCCPAHVTIETGQHSHNHGVLSTDPGNYDPTRTLAVRLKDSGYTTMFGGKFLTNLTRYAPTRPTVRPYAQGWDRFDLIWKAVTRARRFYDYSLWTRGEVIDHGSKPRDHSTFVVASRMADHIRNAPSDKPLFAHLSLFSGHTPNLPMPRFVGHPKCRNVAPFDGPAYNEADVSDKPAHVQAHKRFKQPTYDLTTRCEEMMTIDWAVAQISDALRESDRLDDTLMILTADNGWIMGHHRITTGKRVPYSTPVPLYMLWPNGLDNEARTVVEPVSNVDFAPTICALAGCEMSDADGSDLGPLICGSQDRLDRRYVYEEYLDTVGVYPAWYGLRTTQAYSPDQSWVYTEYQTGERELYELQTDPHQLQNLAGDPAFATRVDELHDMLHEEVITPDQVTWED